MQTSKSVADGHLRDALLRGVQQVKPDHSQPQPGVPVIFVERLVTADCHLRIGNDPAPRPHSHRSPQHPPPTPPPTHHPPPPPPPTPPPPPPHTHPPSARTPPPRT